MCLVICSKTLSYFLTIHKWPKPTAKIGHTDSSYPAPPISYVLATATNPKQIGSTDRDLGLTEMGL